ncbi:hypothetical protein KEM55_004201, partial [Ascosphaera atra]
VTSWPAASRAPSLGPLPPLSTASRSTSSRRPGSRKRSLASPGRAVARWRRRLSRVGLESYFRGSSVRLRLRLGSYGRLGGGGVCLLVS